jgi:(2Fe-2S) ferredoxin
MKTEAVPYEKQIFVCTNDAKGEKPSCGDTQGEAIFKELRRIAKERGLHPNIRVAQAKCLGKCGMGTNIMVYPDNVWYHAVTLDDVNHLAEKYLTKC